MSLLDLFEAKHPRWSGLILTSGYSIDDLLEREF
jgi:hypothetical protein